ncbi:MAG: substrate-binding domain-containing protein [Desulfovibrionales bacterium]|nr:substrate-binding domain-containing protein [Desulfovibrionales bacterium]
MSRKFFLFMVFVLALSLSSVAFSGEKCTAVYGSGPNSFSLATGSPGELGLLRVLAESFSKEVDTALCWVKAGTGDSLKLLKEKAVDMIMVHAPDAEKKAVAEGWAAKRTLIGSNEFYIVGPPNDPANINKAKCAVEAYSRIANAKTKFFSRGDNSGTHKKEMAVWKKAGIVPSGDWYVITKDFMTATLKRADAERGYFMTDSSTWVAEKKNVPNLKILFRGDKFLVNTYHALCRPDGVTDGAPLASRFIDFVASDEGQKIIREYGKEQYGEGLYNDAAYAHQYDN